MSNKSRLFIALLLAFFPVLFAQPAQAVLVDSVDITCKKDGVEETYNTGWDSDNTYFEGVGDIAKFYCEGGHSLLGDGAEYVSDTLGSGEGRFYTGKSTNSTPEPSPEPTASSAASESTEKTTSAVTEQSGPSQEDYDSALARIVELEATIADKDAEIASLNAIIAGLKGSIDSKNQTIASLNGTIDELKASLDASAKSFDELKSTNASLTKQIEEFKISLDKANKEIASQKARGDNAEKTITELKGTITSLNEKIANLQSQVETIPGLKKELDNALANVSKAEQTIKSLEDSLIKANDTIEEQGAQIEELKALRSSEDSAQNSALAEALVAEANVLFDNAEGGSEEYEVGLAMLSLAAEADDPDLPEQLAAVPVIGAVAGEILSFMNSLGNVGADISPEVRERSEEVVIAGVIVGGQIATTSAISVSGGTSNVRMRKL